MANQDFDINIRVNANTAQVDAIRQSFEKLGAQVKVTNAEMAAGGAGGLGGIGSAVGVGTIISLVTTAINKWQEFSDEQDKIIERQMKGIEKSRELGLAVADMFEAMKSAERIETEPLEVSFDRLKQKVIELKTEMHIAFETGAYEDAKKLAASLQVVESQLDGVTSKMEKQTAAADRLAKAREKAAEKEARSEESFLKGATTSASPPVQAALRNEEAARKAEAAGDEISAAQFRRSSEAIQRSMTGGQADEFNQLKTAMDKMNVTLSMILETWK